MSFVVRRVKQYTQTTDTEHVVVEMTPDAALVLAQLLRWRDGGMDYGWAKALKDLGVQVERNAVEAIKQVVL